MAIGRLSVKVGKAGKASPHAAYIARLGQYEKRLEQGEKLEASEFGNMPKWAATNPLHLWEAADAYERKNGTTYREFEIALPREMNPAQRLELVRDFVGQEIGDRLTANTKSRLVFLGWMDAGTRNLITKAPVVKPEDLKGMKIRVQTSPVSLDTLKAMGANAIAMGTSEVFSGMQTGVIDGTENNPPTFVAHNYLPVAKNYTWSKHFIIPELFLFSKAKWDKLKKEDQELIIKLAKEAQIEQRQLWEAYNAKSLETMKANGVNFHDIDTDYFYKATQPVRDQYGKDHQDLIKRIQDVK